MDIPSAAVSAAAAHLNGSSSNGSCSSNSSNSSSSSSSSSSSGCSPLEHALVGWSTLWQFPPPPSVPRSVALAVTREIAAVLALLHAAAAAPAAAPAAAAALPRLLQLAEKGPFKKEIEAFLAALQIRIQASLLPPSRASFDQAVGDLWWETLQAEAAQVPKAAPSIDSSLPSVDEFEERMRLEKEAQTLKVHILNSTANAALHKPLVAKLKTEVEALEAELKAVEEREEALKRELPFAASSSS
ncbi:hypothetical protein ACSSS7_006254 [Eimeria intestinalis]